MALGPGKYDDICTMAREQTGAELVIVIVLGGVRGSGFSCQAIDPATLVAIPDVLDRVADEIRRDAK